METVAGHSAIAAASHRRRVRIAGRVHAVRVQPWAGIATLECTVVDDTGSMTIVFLGRRDYPGLRTGVRLVAEGVVGEHHGRLAMLNPLVEILPEPHGLERVPHEH
jgi:RecG-like helicase